MSDSGNPTDKQDLLAAFDQVLEREKHRTIESAAPTAAPRRTGVLVAAVGVLSIVALGYIWGMRPAWLFPPDPATLFTAEQREATLRFGMYLEAERIRDFLKANGRLPARLEDAGDVEAGVAYSPTGDTTFVLTGTDGAISLRLSSGDAMVEFLAPAGVTPAPRTQ